MEWQVGTAGTVHHQRMPAGVTPEVIAPAASNNGSSSAALIGTCSKFDTVTPSSRTPLAVGSSVRTSSTLACRSSSCRAITIGKLRLRVT